MGALNYYLLSSLPGVGELGSVPPLRLGDYLDQIRLNPRALRIAACILSEERLRELLGRRSGAASLSLLPPEREPGWIDIERLAAVPGDDIGQLDRVWELFFREAAAAARRLSSRLLAAWVAFEVGLRNALAEARAIRFPAAEFSLPLAAELGALSPELSGQALAAWKNDLGPLAVAQGLERVRWRWMAQVEPWFSFSHDEVAFYGLKLLALWRWQRLLGEVPRDLCRDISPR